MTLELTIILFFALCFAARGQSGMLLDPAVGPQPATGFRVAVATAPITADFSFSPSSGAWPLTVQFVDLTQGGPSGWAWDFGDGSTSTAQNPVHTFNSPSNSFPVSLTATGPGGSSSANKSVYVFTVVSAAMSVDLPHGLIFAAGKLWACGGGGTGWLVRFNDTSNLSNQSVLTFAADGKHDGAGDLIYVASKGKLYVCFTSASGCVVSEVDPTALTYTDVIDISSATLGSSLCASASSLFLAATTDLLNNRSGAIRFALAGWAETGRTTNSTQQFAECIRFDGANVYETGRTAPGSIAKIDPSTLAVTFQSFASGDDFATDDLALLGSFAWIGLEAHNGFVLKIAKSDLSITRVNTGIASSTSFGMFSDGTSIWNMVASGPGIVQRIDPNTLAVLNLNLTSSQALPNEMDTDGTSYYVTCFLNPAKVLKITP